MPPDADLSAGQLAAASIRLHDELARGSRAGTATAGGRNMQPMAMAESQVEYLASFAWDGGVLATDVNLGLGTGGLGVDFGLG